MKGSVFLTNNNHKNRNESKREVDQTKNINTVKKIGLIMPISNTDGYKENHWGQVREILEDSIVSVEETMNIKCECQVVSDIAGTEKIIQKNIVTNIYDSDLIICDVSSLNPNVLFELGMRLAFDKQVIIVKDEKTDYIFDTNIIFHTNYDSNLNYIAIKEFKEKLHEDIKKALSAGKENAGYLDAFGDIKVKKMHTEEMDVQSAMEIMMSQLGSLQSDFNRLRREVGRNNDKERLYSDSNIRNSDLNINSNSNSNSNIGMTNDEVDEKILNMLSKDIINYFDEVPTRRMIENYIIKNHPNIASKKLVEKLYHRIV